MYICDMAAGNKRPLRVGIILADRFTLSAFANFIDVFRLASDEGDRSRPILCEWAILGEDRRARRSSCGVKIQPDVTYRTAKKFDYIAVVGGLLGDQSSVNDADKTFLKLQANAGVPLVGLCTGVFILYEAELLHGYRCCVSWFHHHDFTLRFKNAEPISDQTFIVDRDRLTCSGGMSSAHLAAFIVDRHIGQSAATKSLNIMMIDAQLQGNRTQPGFALQYQASDALVRRALFKMQQTIDSPLTISELAIQLNTNRRKLERHFIADIGVPPRIANINIRIEHAHRLVERTNRSLTDIALACGFCDAAHLAKTFKQFRGRNPSAFRMASPKDERKNH
jgi:transcriptional regulator GlxA family with amidase domain